MTPFVRVAAEVQEAVSAGAPVVALESTIFTHGLPRPRNVEVAEEAEQIVRDAGAYRPPSVSSTASRWSA